MHCRLRDIIILLTLCACLTTAASAQVTVKATVDRTTILIGEPIKLNLEATVPNGAPIKWFSIDTIPHFEMVDEGKPDSSGDGPNWRYRQEITLTSFDSGYWTIPSFVLQSGRNRYKTDSFNISVTYTPTDTASDYHDIKDIIAVEAPSNPYLLWIIIAAAVALAALIYFLRRKKPAAKPAGPPVSELSPFEEAVQLLEALRKEDLAAKGEVKQYYTKLNDILRWYVFRRFNISSLEKTNEELIMQLRQTKLPADDYTSLAQSLRMADFVKFAKYMPSAEDQQQAFQVIKQSIARLEATALPPAT